MIQTKRSLIYFIRSMENDVQTTLTFTKPDDYRKQYCFSFYLLLLRNLGDSYSQFGLAYGIFVFNRSFESPFDRFME